MKSKISRRHFNKTLAVGAMGILSGCSLSKQFDIVIRNSTILDGSGSAPVNMDIGIKGNRITI